jgi:DNA-binding NarL/FixJ family response regulator
VREREVLALLAGGHSDREIGAALGISDRTAESHVLHILNKLGVSTRAAAAVAAVRDGLV